MKSKLHFSKPPILTDIGLHYELIIDPTKRVALFSNHIVKHSE